MFDTAWEELVQRSLQAGGFTDLGGLGFRPDATAWAALALAAAGRRRDLVERAGASLNAVQLEDGRVAISPEHPDTFWPTPLAVLAWRCSTGQRKALERAIRFLLETTGDHRPKGSDSPVSHDTAITGWPWVAGTHSWVEPTALSLAALKVTGNAVHPRAKEAVRMLMDRQLPGGGWNYGNVKVYGRELYSQVDCTGVALEALAGLVPRARIQNSIERLKREILSVRTPSSLGWGLLGLGAWGERPEQARAWVAEAFGRYEDLGQCRTWHLALLLLAAEARGGLAGALEGGRHEQKS